MWWDVTVEPAVTWRDGAFALVDPDRPDDPSRRVDLWRPDVAPAAPEAVAAALAEGLAGCDVPPTGDGVSERRIAVTLRAMGVDPAPARPGA